MSLASKIEGVWNEPDSVHARVLLAAELARLKIPDALQVLEVALEQACWQGQFFEALGLCRYQFQGRQVKRQLRRLALFFSAEANPPKRSKVSGVRASGELTLPHEPEKQIALAVELGTRLSLPEEPQHNIALPIFRKLSIEHFVLLASRVEPFSFSPGQMLIEQGKAEPYAFLLSQGVLWVKQTRANKEEVTLAEIELPALVGEMQALTKIPHRASVIAESFGTAWRIDLSLLESLGGAQFSLYQELRAILEERWIHNLKQVSTLLRNLNERETFLEVAQVRVILPGTEVIKQGTRGEGLFLVLHGEALVTKKADGGRRLHIAELSEGDIFGEMSSLTGERTTASVWMPQGGVVLHISLETYKKLRSELPDLEKHLKKMVLERKEQLRELVEPMGGLIDQASISSEAWLMQEDEENPLLWLDTLDDVEEVLQKETGTSSTK